MGEQRERGSRTTANARGPALLMAGFSMLAPQLLGGATSHTALAILVLGAGVSVFAAMRLRKATRRLGSVPFAAVGFLTVTFATLLQLVPIPCSWTPSSAEQLGELVALGAIDHSRCTISVAPAATRAAFWMGAVQNSLVLCAAGLARAGHRRTLQRGIAFGSILMAVVALIHAVLGAGSVFGVYTPAFAKPGLLLAPLLNGNHLAGHLALGFPLCLALALDSERLDLRVTWLGAGFVVLLASLFTLSRAGIAATFAGGVGYAVLHAVGKRDKNSNPRAVAWGLTAACGLATAAYLTADMVAREFGDTASAARKVDLIRRFAGLVAGHPLVGVGRGAFGDVSASVSGNTRVWYAENILVQWAVEWGLPLTVLLVLCGGLSAWSLRPRDKVSWALALGLLALIMQNLVDFSLELAGLGCVAAVALGTLLGDEKPARHLDAVLALPLRPVLAPAAGVALAGFLLAVSPLTTLSRASLLACLRGSEQDEPGSFSRILSDALKAYPADPSFLLLGASHATTSADPLAARWVNLALRVAPTWSSPHQQAAYLLERRGRLEQAALELSLSTRIDQSAQALGCAFVQRHPSAQLAWDAAPDESPARQPTLEHLAHCLAAANHKDAARSLLQMILSRYPGSLYAGQQLSEIALVEHRYVDALTISRSVSRNAPNAPSAVATLIRVLARTGDAAGALLTFEHSPRAAKVDRTVLTEAANAAAMAHDGARLEQLCGDLLAATGSGASERSHVHLQASLWFDSANLPAQALSHAQAAYELAGEPGALERVYQLANRAGIAQVALRAAVGLCHVRHRGETYCQLGGP